MNSQQKPNIQQRTTDAASTSRFRSPVACSVAISMCVFTWVLITSPNFGAHSNQVGSPIAGDFLQEWIGGYSYRTYGADSLFDTDQLKALQHDERLLGFRWADNEYFSMVYPPFYYLFWVPFSFLDYKVAAYVFVGIMIACFFVSLFLLGKSSIFESRFATDDEESNTDKLAIIQRLWPWVFIVGAIYVPMIRSITTGQKGTLCLLILVGTYVLYDRNKNFMAGLVFGLLAFKPHLTLVIGVTMLIRRQWSFVAGAVSSVLLLVAMCFSMGSGVCQQYTEFALGASQYVNQVSDHLHKSHCLYGFLALMSGGQATMVSKILWVASMVFVVISLIAMFRKTKELEKSVSKAIEFSALIIATILLAPHLLTYDLTMMIIPMCLLMALVVHGHLSKANRQQLILYTAAFFVASGFSHSVAVSTGVQFSTLCMIGIFLVLTWQPKPQWSTNRMGTSPDNHRVAAGGA